MDPDEDSDEAEDAINVASIDLTSPARGPGRPPSYHKLGQSNPHCK